MTRPILLITDRADHSVVLAEEFNFWIRDTAPDLFPEPTPLFYEQAAWGNITRKNRLVTLTQLAAYHLPGAEKPVQPPVIITTVRSVMTRTLPRRDFIRATRILKKGQQITPESLRRNWVEIGYQHADMVLESGQFSHRGGIMDIWIPSQKYPVRMEFFGNEIETMRSFEPASQRRLENLNSIQVTPAREILPGRAREFALPSQEPDEFYLPLVHSLPASILDYLPENALVVLDGEENLKSLAQEVEENAVKLRKDSIQEGLLPEDFPVPYLSWSELSDIISGHHWVDFGRSGGAEPSAISEVFTPGSRFGGRLKPLMDTMVEYSSRKEKILLISRQVSRLRELWKESSSFFEGCFAPEFMEGSLSEGWTLLLNNGEKCHLITDSEIFGWERPKPRARQAAVTSESPEMQYADLKAGDWVVHIDFGIGKFIGLVKRILEGVEKEFLCVEYEGGDQIFVPVYQAERLSRYVGPGGEDPAPTRLGGSEWSQTKQRVKDAVREVAQDLLVLYAKRQISKGFAFRKDVSWQQELEASFPYIETEDQERAIQDVKKDMESPRPMDRLLCGDVGYGKTEVALRAAFKAVMDGKQVGLLVPTTVLAQQHYDTFRQRLAPFPVEVEMLSRFRTPKEQDVILEKLEKGGIDIIIGTHRLLQGDVRFKDLGLLIIDEEQRFGVAHKEHFKKLRTEIDVLTLTATPIPRTLYMALTGVRDISTINTPPAERLPVITHVGAYSPRLVRQAILRELERGGQVFFVHNRVQTIHGMEMHLKNLVPEARIGIAHGQMHEAGLAEVMHQFTRGEIDVLLCTSIIESGLDIPNANTLIVDRGDTFGLAQLYQLRGRVGRGAQRAYAYFFRHKKRSPTPEGQERLEVIAENTQLGSGYSIAMRDLEMRGAGDLLGTRQHGYIAAVGFHLYTRLLANEVRQIQRVQGIPVSPENDHDDEFRLVNVDLPLAIGIPVEYIPQPNIRLQLYRRLAEISKEVEIDRTRDEFSDRFGVIPQPLSNLFYLIRVKLRAEAAGLASVSMEGDQIVLRYPQLAEGVTTRNLRNIGLGTRTGKNGYWLPIDKNNLEWQSRLLDVLLTIIET
ncbi:MAG TPA: transcription-repair coupling factor [Anaerolineaceae bacterium]